jgi:alpha-tubulin suppressor-like RCC1 family protein
MKRITATVISTVLILSACSFFTFENPADPRADNFGGIIQIDGIDAIESSYSGGLLFLVNDTVYRYSTSGEFSTLFPPQTEITAISGSTYHKLALDSDGQVWAWGYSESGLLGVDSNLIETGSHLVVPGIDVPATFIRTGNDKSAAGTGTDTTYIWGDFRTENTTLAYTEPTAKSWGIVKDIAFGYYDLLILKDDGKVYTWNADITEPEAVAGLSNITAISVSPDNESYIHYLALDGDGRVWSWGENYRGQLGDGTTDDRTVPGLVPGLTGVTSIRASSRQSLALTDTALYGWGANINGSLGSFWISDFHSPTILSADWMPENPIPINFYSNGWDTVIYTDACHLYGLGYSSPAPMCGYLDGCVTGLLNFSLGNTDTAVAGSMGYSDSWSSFGMLLMDDGSLRGFGDNSSGMMGNNTTGLFTELEDPGLSGFKSIAAGGGHVIAVETGGTVKTWGEGSHGQLGDGADIDSLVPVTASGLSGIRSAAAGLLFSLALKDDGTVWGWGWSSSGAIGPTSPSTAETVSGLTGITAVAAGYDHSLFLKGDGTVWALGYNSDGQLGNGTTIDSDVPVQAAELTGITQIAASNSISAALKSDGTVWGWGYAVNNSLSQGDSFTTFTATPYQIGDFTTASAIAVGDNKILILLEDGSLLITGNSSGMTKQANIVAPGPCPLDTFEGITITKIDGGHYGFIIIDDGGKAYSWLP